MIKISDYDTRIDQLLATIKNCRDERESCSIDYCVIGIENCSYYYDYERVIAERNNEVKRAGKYILTDRDLLGQRLAIVESAINLCLGSYLPFTARKFETCKPCNCNPTCKYTLEKTLICRMVGRGADGTTIISHLHSVKSKINGFENQSPYYFSRIRGHRFGKAEGMVDKTAAYDPVAHKRVLNMIIQCNGSPSACQCGVVSQNHCELHTEYERLANLEKNERRIMKVKDIPTVLNALDANEQFRKKVCILFVSEPGIGKTEVISEWAKSKGKRLVHLIGSQINPTEVAGIAVPDYEAKTMTYLDSDKLASMQDGDVLFLDELWQSPKQVLQAELTLVQDRRLASGRELKDIILIAAANPISKGFIEKSVQERFTEIEIHLDAVDAIGYLVKKHGIIATAWRPMLDATKEDKLSPRTVEKQILMSLSGISEGIAPNVITNIANVYRDNTRDININKLKAMGATEYQFKQINAHELDNELTEQELEALLCLTPEQEAVVEEE